MEQQRTEGPRFTVETWREQRDPHGLLWFARATPVRPEAAPFTEARDAARAVVEARRRLPGAIRAAAARLLAEGGAG